MAESNASLRPSRWIRNPSIQFFVALLFAPVLAIAGEAHSGFSSVTGRLGLMLALSIVAYTGIRSYRFERANLPQTNLLFQVADRNSLLVRYLLGVATLLVFLVPAAIAAAVALVMGLAGI